MSNDWFYEYFINELKAIGRKPTSNMQHEVVDSLPSSGNEQTIYFVKNDSSSSNNYYDEYVWISSSSAFEKIGSTQIDGSTTQSDWNQNDATQPDYVKSRPFYTGDPAETVLVEETTVAFQDADGVYVAVPQLTFAAIVGDTYKVTWDGTVYERVCKELQEVPCIGNLSILGLEPDTGEPFIAIIEDGILIQIATTDASSFHTISISGMVLPVIKIDEKYLPFPFKPKGESYLTFSSPNEFTLKVCDETKHWDGTLEYFASNEIWTIWDGSTLSSVYNGSEYVLYLRGIGNSVITGNSFIFNWDLAGINIKCIGNIENLLDYATVESGNHPNMADYCYNAMFNGNASLIQAPTLPATTLTKSCYGNMFTGCTSLTEAPALPAITLAERCYLSMFKDCTSLVKIPVLPATELAYDCYGYMFDGCTSLTKTPALPATTLAEDCYAFMFNGCASLKLSTTKTDEYIQEYRMPSSGNGVTAIRAMQGMFSYTGGTFAGTPEINTTYYLSSENMIVRETEIATLNGYVDSMIDAAISEYADTAEYIIPSSTEGSTKKFKITVDDSGTISATEVT